MTTNLFLKMMAFCLAMFCVLGSFAACGKKEQDPNNENENTLKTEEDTSHLYDANGFLKDTIPEGTDYDETVKVLCWITSQVDEFGMDSEKQDVITTAFRNRNSAVQERLNITLDFNQILGDNPNQGSFVDTAVNSIMSDDDGYDLIGCYSMVGGTLATKGMLTDLYSLEYPDFDKPWWSDMLGELSEIGGKLYFASGDISGEALYNMMFMLYNADMGEGLGISDPRKMVLNGTWTMEEMYRLATDVYVDENHDGVKSAGDRFGLLVASQVSIEGFFYGSGYAMTESDENGNVVLSRAFKGTESHDLLTRLTGFIYGTDYGFYENSNQNFRKGYALLGTSNAANFKYIKEAGWNYSLMTFPKLNADQDRYYSALGFGYSNYCIPISASDTAMSAVVMECMASESYRKTTPAIFDTTFLQYAGDDLDWQIFNLIKDGMVSDHARIFSSSFSWSTSALGLFRNCVINNTAGSWISDVQNQVESIEGKFESIMSGNN
ncbi:MAG: hypothetical protein IKC59_01935 [Clostridia bacterium]|nr:hypothetical protein [Clostridia bacterium]